VQSIRFSQLIDLSIPGCPIYVYAGVLAADPRGRVRVVSGRGLGQQEARERCLAEGAERSLAIWDEKRPVLKAALSELTVSAVDPRHLLLISEAQYARREAWNATVPWEHHWPPPIDPEQPLDWIEAQPLSGGDPVLVPAAYCFLGYPNALHHGFTIPDSSGLAAGDNVCSAVERAILELVERDAVAIWWYNRLQRPLLPYDRDQLPWLSAFEEYISDLDRRFWVLDLTHDFRVPVAAAISSGSDDRELAFGFAAGWTAEEATTLALGELVQFEVSKRLQAKAGTHDFISLARTKTLDEFDFLVPDAGGPVQQPLRRSAEEFPAVLAHQGLRAFKVDFSHDGYSVVRIIVPGLRPLWPRFAAGRLSDVPYRLGWVVEPMPEASLNPVPILY
jgi:oxazoline/thiazoline synthase